MIDRLNHMPAPTRLASNIEPQNAVPEFLQWTRGRSAPPMPPRTAETPEAGCVIPRLAPSPAFARTETDSVAEYAGPANVDTDRCRHVDALALDTTGRIGIPVTQDIGLPVQPIGATTVAPAHDATGTEANTLADASDIASHGSARSDPQAAIAAARIEVRLRDATGREEILSWPWRLAAGPSLSLRIDGGAERRADRANRSIATASAPASANAGLAGVAVGLSPATPARMTVVVDATAHKQLREPGSRLAQIAQEAAETPALSGAASALVRHASDEWQARWERWIARDGRVATVLVRDYRNSEDDTARLTERILAFCREHDLRAQRIVINGHERWRGADPREEAACR